MFGKALIDLKLALDVLDALLSSFAVRVGRLSHTFPQDRSCIMPELPPDITFFFPKSTVSKMLNK